MSSEQGDTHEEQGQLAPAPAPAAVPVPTEAENKSKKQDSQVEMALKRMETKLEELCKKRKQERPVERAFYPNTFNSLSSYCDTHTINYVVYGPENKPKKKYIPKNTAIGLMDPWESYRMDVSVAEQPKYLPARREKSSSKIESAPVVEETSTESKTKPKEESTPKESQPEPEDPKQEDTDQKEELKEDQTAEETEKKAEQEKKKRKTSYYFDEVPALRRELVEKFSFSAQSKIKADYSKTKEDFYHRRLNDLKHVPKSSRDNLTQSYYAYLQNTPGSKSAVYECVKELRSTFEESTENPPSDRDHNKKTESEDAATDKAAEGAGKEEKPKPTNNSPRRPAGGQKKIDEPAKKQSTQAAAKDSKVRFAYVKKYGKQDKEETDIPTSTDDNAAAQNKEEPFEQTTKEHEVEPTPAPLESSPAQVEEKAPPSVTNSRRESEKHEEAPPAAEDTGETEANEAEE